MRSRKTAKPGGRTRFRGEILGYFDPSAHPGSPPLLHFPAVSKTTGEQVDWLHGTPKSGYEFRKTFGPHTIELGNVELC